MKKGIHWGNYGLYIAIFKFPELPQEWTTSGQCVHTVRSVLSATPYSWQRSAWWTVPTEIKLIFFSCYHAHSQFAETVFFDLLWISFETFFAGRFWPV